jgi:predicted RNase H-like nuclease (RuvC/YqgF family)
MTEKKKPTMAEAAFDYQERVCGTGYIKLIDLRRRAESLGEGNAPALALLAEQLEDIIDAVEELSGERGMVVEELARVIRAADDEHEGDLEAKDKEREELAKAHAKAIDELNEHVKKLDGELVHRADIIDELKKRAELAEHELTTSVAKAIEGSSRVLYERIAQLETALAHARGANPIKSRKGKS